MIYLVGGIFALSMVTFYLIVREFNDTFEKERQEWRKEREILLNRIADPEYKPPEEKTSPLVMTLEQVREHAQRVKEAQEEADEMGKVGRIIE